ncbi:MAG: hypothetical protein M3O31_13905 [Acidobacteriota bacterium]|nr:hypothetical protein [Acidobacteriota bacterium]
MPFAAIPLLFGIQQLTEGVIWLTFSHDAPLLKQVMTYLYSAFSHVLWPMYVPFAVGHLEAVRWRKNAIFAFEAAGVAVGLYLLYFIVASPVVAEVIGNHIVYLSPHFYVIPMMDLYLAATCFSCFFSSHGFVRLFGVLTLGSFIAAYIVQVMATVSIWCFFAAILSLLIYLHLRFRSLGGFPGTGVSAGDRLRRPNGTIERMTRAQVSSRSLPDQHRSPNAAAPVAAKF